MQIIVSSHIESPFSLTCRISHPFSRQVWAFYKANKNVGDLVTLFHEHVTCRAGFLLGAFLYPTTSTIDFLTGSIAGALAIGSAGCFPNLNRQFFLLTRSAGEGLLSETYSKIINFINPGTCPYGHRNKNDFIVLITQTELIRMSLFEKGYTLSQSESFFESQVLSRLTYLATVPVLIVTRTVDLAIGILSALGSILLLGTDDKLIFHAAAGLKAPLLITQVGSAILLSIKPHHTNALLE